MKASKEHKQQQSRVISRRINNGNLVVQKVPDNETQNFMRMCAIALVMASNARGNVNSPEFFCRYFHRNIIMKQARMQKYKDIVRNVYKNIIDHLGDFNKNHFKIRTNEDKDTFAYVRPDHPLHKINLCPAYLSAAETGRDSKPGVIIHELSHFTDIGGTQDYAYGDDARNLSIRKAVNNADNYEYAAEQAWG